MTGAQRRVLDAVAQVGSVHGADIPNEARGALVGLGFIEADGPNGWFRLTHAGRQAIDELRRRSA